MSFRFLPAAAILVASCTAAPPGVAADSGITQIAERTITVTGIGEASAAPDMAVVTIGVETDAKTAQEALRQNSETMSATIDKLKSLRVAARDIQTTGLSINPRYDYDRDRSAPELIGFRASNAVQVRLRDLENAGSVIDQAISSGANSLRGISLTFAEPKPIYEAARRDGVADAQARAALLADAAGVKLGQILSISDSQIASPVRERVVMTSARMDSANAVPLESGESTVSARVTMVYAID